MIPLYPRGLGPVHISTKPKALDPRALAISRLWGGQLGSGRSHLTASHTWGRLGNPLVSSMIPPRSSWWRTIRDPTYCSPVRHSTRKWWCLNPSPRWRVGFNCRCGDDCTNWMTVCEVWVGEGAVGCDRPFPPPFPKSLPFPTLPRPPLPDGCHASRVGGRPR